MRLVIVTGMSGAGKSTALKMLEDMGYFCVDNLPVPLIPKMAELLYGNILGLLPEFHNNHSHNKHCSDRTQESAPWSISSLILLP